MQKKVIFIRMYSGKVYSIVKEEEYYLVNIYNFENLELITLLNNNNFFINDNTKIIAKK